MDSAEVSSMNDGVKVNQPTADGRSLRRVLLADDQTVFIETLAKLLSSRYEVIGLVDNGRALREFSRMLHPDVIVTDITMPLLNGLEAVRTIRKDARPPKVVFLSMHVVAYFVFLSIRRPP